MSYTHAVYSIEVVGKLFVFHAFIDIPSSLVETKLIFAKVQRALRSIFHGAQSKLSTEGTDHWKFIHGGHGSSEIYPRMTRRARIFWSCFARNLWRKSFLKMLLTQEINHRNLNGIKTDILGLRERKKSLEEIFFKNGRGPEIIYHSSRQSQHNL